MKTQGKMTFPRMGVYTPIFSYMAEKLGYEPIIPPPVSQETIKKGVRLSSGMMCFPFKATLGNLIEGLDKGAYNILATVSEKSSIETCRFGFYFPIQEQILRREGYKFDMKYMTCGGWGTFKDIKRLNPKLKFWEVPILFKNVYEKMKEVEEKEFKFEPKDLNIGLVGEAYTLWEEGVNYGIIDKLKKMDCGVDMSLKLSWFVKHQLGLADTKKHLHKEAKKYLFKRIGGHGLESVINTIDYAKKGFDGVIHLTPLSCMPETTVEMVVDMIGKDYGLPIYRFPIDENNFEAGFDTRLETFVKLLKRKKNAK